MTPLHYGWSAIGIAQLITAMLLFQRSPVGAFFAITGATISAFMTIFLIFEAPEWAITILSMDLGIIWIITANGEDFDYR